MSIHDEEYAAMAAEDQRWQASQEPTCDVCGAAGVLYPSRAIPDGYVCRFHAALEDEYADDDDLRVGPHA